MKKWMLFILCFIINLACYSAALPPPAAEVFQVQASIKSPDTINIHWDIKPGFYIYKDRIHLKFPQQYSARLGTIIYPEAQNFTDSQGKIHTVYSNNLSLSVPILFQKAGEYVLNLSYQGCAEDGFCYPPEIKDIIMQVTPNLELHSIQLKTAPLEETEPVALEEPVNSYTSIFERHHWVITTLIFYGFGLLLAFTPCVLPMVPVLSGIIVGHGPTITTRKAFMLSLSYVLSMSITYAVAGAVVALLGSNLQILFQSPWIIALFSLIFVLLSLSMFGFYELRLPASLQDKLSLYIREGSGHYLGAAIMGCLSTLILSPCVTAPLIGALGYIASSGDIFLGMITLFFLGLGMGTPLLIIGISAGKILPKAGPWMNTIKSIFGILLLAVAIHLISRVLPEPISMVLWAALFIFTGIYTGALTRSSTLGEKFFQGLGIMLLLYGLLILIGASMGEGNPLQPLKILQKKSLMDTHKITVSTLSDLELALQEAKGKPVIVDFYADWCTACKIMEKTTFQDPDLQKALQDFVFITVDITQNTEARKVLLQHYHIVAPPTFLFFDKTGKLLTEMTLVGEVSAENFLAHIRSLA